MNRSMASNLLLLVIGSLLLAVFVAGKEGYAIYPGSYVRYERADTRGNRILRS